MSIKNVEVSGAIVTYNNADTIESCISSIIQNTTGVCFKLYVIDNCSSDGTVELIQKKFPMVEIIKSDINAGFGHGHNMALKYITSKYHFVINPDVVIKEDAITSMVQYMEQNADTLMITPRILNMDGTEQFLPKRNPSIRYLILSKFKPLKKYRRIYTRQDENLEIPTQIDFCTGCFFGIRTEKLKDIGGFDTRFFMYFEDADLARRVKKDGDVIFYPDTSIYHEWHRDNMRNVKGMLRWGRSMIRYFNKWGWKF